MSTVQTYGWVLPNELKNQCRKCHWVLIQRSLAACEFDKQEFPRAIHCLKFEETKNDVG